MNTGFTIGFRHSTGNLHIYPKGEFNGMCAWELIKTIKRRYNGTGRVFVSTAGLARVLPIGIRLFKEHMTPKILPLDRLYIKGEKGFTIGPDGSRVIICKKECGRQKNIPMPFPLN